MSSSHQSDFYDAKIEDGKKELIRLKRKQLKTQDEIADTKKNKALANGLEKLKESLREAFGR